MSIQAMILKQNMQSPRILLIHFHSMQNAGDAAQLEAAILNLRQHFHEPRIWVAANYPDEKELQDLNVKILPSMASLIGVGGKSLPHSKLFHLVKALIYLALAWITRKIKPNLKKSRQNWSGLFNAYRTADIVVSSPGNIFFTMGHIGFPFLCSSLAFLPAFIFEKPVYILPQTIGPIKRKWEKWILKQLYQRPNIIYLREPISYRLAQELELPMDRVRLALDQTIELKDPENEEVPNKLKQVPLTTARNAIGVTVIPRMIRTLPRSTLNLYYQALAGSLTYLVLKHGMEIYFFPQVVGPTPQEDDRKAFEKVTSLMTCPPEHIKILDDTLDHNTLQHLYQRMDLFLASRLHSGLFAMSYGIPTLMIGYLTKTKGIMELLDLEEWLLDIEDIDQHTLTRKLGALWQQHIQISSQIQRKISDALKRTPDPGLEIATDFYYGVK